MRSYIDPRQQIDVVGFNLTEPMDGLDWPEGQEE